MLLEEAFLKREGEEDDERKMMLGPEHHGSKTRVESLGSVGKIGRTQLLMSSEGNSD